MGQGELTEVMDFLSEIGTDSTVPKNVKIKIDVIMRNLSEPTELSVRINKVQNELEEIMSDVNLQSHTRTQLMMIASMLEKF